MITERDIIADGMYKQTIITLSSLSDKRAYIRDNLIPRMDQKRRRGISLTSSDIVKRLFNTPPDKQGETYELLIGELKEKGFSLTSSIASEVADVVYYTSHPNCPDYLKDPTPLFEFLGIEMDIAVSFCILKYETRFVFDYRTDHKEIENETLRRFLSDLNNPR